jgi:hypothetical protein
MVLDKIGAPHQSAVCLFYCSLRKGFFLTFLFIGWTPYFGKTLVIHTHGKMSEGSLKEERLDQTLQQDLEDFVQSISRKLC